MTVVYFRSPFFRGEERVEGSAQRLGIDPIRLLTLKRDFLRLPQHQDGFPFPCGACRRVLLSRAARILRRWGLNLVVTGEVVGAGGLSRDDLLRLEVETGLVGRVLRPLSAHLLPPTLAEATGYVDRAKLLGLDAEAVGAEGLLGIAQELALPQRERGRVCLLANPVFAQRCLAFGEDGPLTANFIRLLEFRHVYRLGEEVAVVVATSPAEQAKLQEVFLPDDVRLYVAAAGSPLSLIRAPWHVLTPAKRAKVLSQAAQLLLALANFPEDRPWTVCFRGEDEDETQRMTVVPHDLEPEAFGGILLGLNS